MRRPTPIALLVSLLALAGLSSAQGEAPSEKIGPIRVKLDRAIKIFQDERTAAGKALVIEIEQARKDLRTKLDLNARQKISAEKRLRAEQSGFEKDRTIPRSPHLEDAVIHYVKKVLKIREACEKAFEIAIEAFGRIDLALAEKTIAEKERVLGKPPVLPPAFRKKANAKPDQRPRDRGRYDRELLRNRGCEDPLDAQGRIPGWSAIKGIWHRGKPDRKPARGKCYFSASKLRLDAPAWKVVKIQQVVDLSDFAIAIDKERVKARFSYQVSAFKQPPGDRPQVQLIFINENGDDIGDFHDSGQVRCDGQWKRTRTSLKVPKGTRGARVLLISHRKRPKRRNNQHSNDGHFDDLSLKLTR